MNNSGKRSVPDFIGIGAPRSGSTWLHVMLSQHPDVYMPPIKEVHYFDSIDPGSNESFNIHSFFGRYRRLFVSRIKHYLGYIASLAIESFRHKAKPDLAWDARFFLPGGDIQWYVKLFRHAASKHRIVGEVTPAYIMLSEEVVASIYERVGVRKIVVILRNPISATWSCIEKQVRDGGGSSLTDMKFNDEAILQKIRSPGLFDRFNYAENLARWFKYYDRRQIFIGFYEELEKDPQDLLSRAFRFLEVEDISSNLVGKEARLVNAARGMLGEIPDSARIVLAEMHADQLGELAGMIQGYAVAWSAEAKNVLESKDRKI